MRPRFKYWLLLSMSLVSVSQPALSVGCGNAEVYLDPGLKSSLAACSKFESASLILRPYVYEGPLPLQHTFCSIT